MTDETRVLAVSAGILMLAGPRRTRPLAGFFYGVYLSRAHGAGRARLERVVHDVFEQRKSVTARVEVLETDLVAFSTTVVVLSGALNESERDVDALRGRVETLERSRSSEES